MASLEECEQAFTALAERLATADPANRRKSGFNRSLSCTLRDLEVTFGARLTDGRLSDVRRADTADGQVRMAMSSDDLVKLVSGELHMATAWASGRVKIDASMFDIIRLRSIF